MVVSAVEMVASVVVVTAAVVVVIEQSTSTHSDSPGWTQASQILL